VTILDTLLGKPLASSEEAEQKIGVAAGVRARRSRGQFSTATGACDERATSA